MGYEVKREIIERGIEGGYRGDGRGGEERRREGRGGETDRGSVGERGNEGLVVKVGCEGWLRWLVVTVSYDELVMRVSKG